MGFGRPQGLMCTIARLLKFDTGGLTVRLVPIGIPFGLFRCQRKGLGSLHRRFGGLGLSRLFLAPTLNPLLGGRNAFPRRSRPRLRHFELALRVGQGGTSGLQGMLDRPGLALGTIERLPTGAELDVEQDALGLCAFDTHLILSAILFRALDRSESQIPAGLPGLQSFGSLFTRQFDSTNFALNGSQFGADFVERPLLCVDQFTQLEVGLALLRQVLFNRFQCIGRRVKLLLGPQQQVFSKAPTLDRFIAQHQPQEALLVGTLGLERAHSLGNNGLLFQLCDALVQFSQQIVDAAEIVPGIRETVLGLLSAFAIPRNTRGFFQKTTQIFRPCFEDSGNHALTNDGVGPGAQPSP